MKMKKIINLMINKYNINKIGLDFMGYRVTSPKDLSYHHLIIEKKDGGKETIENGAPLNKISHRYLNLIERTNYNIFKQINNEMIKENKQGFISIINLYKIDILLLKFEKEYLKKKKVNVLDIYRKRYLRELNPEILQEIDKYELKKDLHL